MATALLAAMVLVPSGSAGPRGFKAKKNDALSEPRVAAAKSKPRIAKKYSHRGGLQARFDALSRALTTHDVKTIRAPEKGKRVTAQVFFNLGGRGTLHLAGASHRDIYSVNDTWHTVDMTLSNFIAEREQSLDVGDELVVSEGDLNENRFGTPRGPAWGPRSYVTKRAGSLSAEERETMAAVRKPGVRMRTAMSGFGDVEVKLVGRVLDDATLEVNTANGGASAKPSAPLSFRVVKGQTLKVLTSTLARTSYEASYPDSTVVVYYLDDATGSRTVIDRINMPDYGGKGTTIVTYPKPERTRLPLLLKAPGNGTYLLEYEVPARLQKQFQGPHKVAVRVEETFESQSDAQLVDEMAAFQEYKMGR